MYIHSMYIYTHLQMDSPNSGFQGYKLHFFRGSIPQIPQFLKPVIGWETPFIAGRCRDRGLGESDALFATVAEVNSRLDTTQIYLWLGEKLSGMIRCVDSWELGWWCYTLMFGESWEWLLYTIVIILMMMMLMMIIITTTMLMMLMIIIIILRMMMTMLFGNDDNTQHLWKPQKRLFCRPIQLRKLPVYNPEEERIGDLFGWKFCDFDCWIYIPSIHLCVNHQMRYYSIIQNVTSEKGKRGFFLAFMWR